jgi:hypothetical protein
VPFPSQHPDDYLAADILGLLTRDFPNRLVLTKPSEHVEMSYEINIFRNQVLLTTRVLLCIGSMERI